MALIRKNGEYVKVNFSNYKIVNGEIIVNLSCYKNKSNRDYEKNNEFKIKNFLLLTDNYISNLKNEIISELKSIFPDEITHNNYSQFEQIYKNYPDLENKINLLREFQNEFIQIKYILDNRAQYTQNLKYINKFTSLGLDENWLHNPVVKTEDITINIGQIASGQITPANIYQQVKTKLVETQDDI